MNKPGRRRAPHERFSRPPQARACPSCPLIETAMRDHTTASRSNPQSLPPHVGVSRAVGHPEVMQSFDCVDAPCLLVTYAASARVCGAVPPWPVLAACDCLKRAKAVEASFTMAEGRQRWSSSFSFVLASVGSAIGFGNIW